MKTLIENFPKQLREAVSIAQSTATRKQKIKQVLITGLGGSGIGGTIASELVSGHCKVPVTVSKGYFIPAFVNEKTLVVVSSYSGNTEETISAMKQALEKKAQVTVITSGGWIAEEARKQGLDIFHVPGGFPPRACLGYSLVILMHIFHAHKLIRKTPLKDFIKAAALLEKQSGKIVKEAQKISDFLKGKLPVIYATTGNEGIAIRFRQQLNENSKMLCWHHVVPEMNHNELVGWRNKNENLAVIFLRHEDEFERNVKRIEINREIISHYTPHILPVFSKGKSAIEKCIYLIHLTDWVSWFLSVENQVDANEIDAINHLKNELSKF
ncbi:MAG: bifunctional phosphoglucose/phosphomannose isomerase [Bacteroidota bacterium]